MPEPTVHSLDNRLSVVEAWKASQIEGAARAEEQVMLKIGNMIDEKLDKRFGWMSRLVDAAAIAIAVAVILAVVGLG